jgi:tetratricopeptide (TPR) repeat protein
MPGHRPASILAAVALLALATQALAQAPTAPLPPEPAPTPLPAEYSDEARRAYAAGLKDARELIAQRRHDAAIARLDALVADRPREPQARFLKSVAQSESGRAVEAMATLTSLASDFPELPEVHNNLAVLHAARGDLDLARRELELALAAAPDYAPAHENLGDVHARLALDAWSRAAALDRGRPAAALEQKLKLVREALAPR